MMLKYRQTAVDIEDREGNNTTAAGIGDLVDYVSEEATRAGTNAAKYVQSGCKDEKSDTDIRLVATEGARYTVPSTINVSRMEDNLTVRFRVGAVYKDSYAMTYGSLKVD